MKLSLFNFDLPKELLSQYPPKKLGDSRLMFIDRKSEKISHLKFDDLTSLLNQDDLMIVNNTRVFPARLLGRKEKTGAKIEVLLLREINQEQRLWDVLVEPARKIRIGNKLFFGDDESLIAEVIDNTTSRGRTIRFLFKGPYQEFKNKLRNMGKTPLPKYIKRETNDSDKDRYQTIFAEKEGAIAAPTAGLHFSRNLIKKLEINGVHIGKITLHVGLGTFAPIEVEDLSKHKMTSENFIISEKTAQQVNETKKKKLTVCAVGTTVMRAMESSVTSTGMLKEANGWTHKFIYPPYEFSVANAMITNFHLPKSTLLIMVAAFAGKDLIMHAYKEAIKKKYRFYTYGDAMIIL